MLRVLHRLRRRLWIDGDKIEPIEPLWSNPRASVRGYRNLWPGHRVTADAARSMEYQGQWQAIASTFRLEERRTDEERAAMMRDVERVRQRDAARQRNRIAQARGAHVRRRKGRAVPPPLPEPDGL